MVIITSAAYLRIAECGLHGHYVLPTGELSREFFSREGALDERNRLHEEGLISSEEAKFLSSQTPDHWPRLNDDVLIEVRVLCHLTDGESEEGPTQQSEQQPEWTM